MKWLLFTVLVLSSTVSYGAELRQNYFKDVYGNTVYTYNDDNGGSSTISRNPFNDVNGNPVYTVQNNNSGWNGLAQQNRRNGGFGASMQAIADAMSGN